MDFEERKKLFLEKYKPIMEEFKVDLFSYPLFVPDGNGGFKVVIQTDIVDIANSPTKSPFQVE